MDRFIIRSSSESSLGLSLTMFYKKSQLGDVIGKGKKKKREKETTFKRAAQRPEYETPYYAKPRNLRAFRVLPWRSVDFINIGISLRSSKSNSLSSLP